MQFRSMTVFYVLIVALLAAIVQPALANEDDRFWDASGSLGGVTMKAKYKESPENGFVDQTLEVQIDNAPANVKVGVFLNGKRIGSMVTDLTGTGHFRLDKLRNVPGADGRPTGARINDGDVIAVGGRNQQIKGTFTERQ